MGEQNMETDNRPTFCKDYVVHFNQNASWKMDKFHFHDTYEILLSLSDGGEFFVGEATYPIARGSLLVFNNMDLHRSAGGSIPYERYVVHFIPEFAASLSSPQTNLLRCFEHPVGSYTGNLMLSPLQTDTLVRLVRDAQNTEDRESYGDDLKRRIAFMRLLLYINILYDHPHVENSLTQKESFHKVQPILTYVQQNYQNPITLDSIAQQFFMSKYYLCHVFKDVTGFGLNEYIINLRILKARELLRQNISVQQVGEIVGFSNNSHFIRTFKSMVGVSPGQYSHRYR